MGETLTGNRRLACRVAGTHALYQPRESGLSRPNMRNGTQVELIENLSAETSRDYIML